MAGDHEHKWEFVRQEQVVDGGRVVEVIKQYRCRVCGKIENRA
jgi:hypothetical protein